MADEDVRPTGVQSGLGDAATNRAQLERWVRSPTTPQRLVRRSRIVLLHLEGASVCEIADRLGISRATVKLWLARFRAGGPEALRRDASGRGRHAAIDASAFEDQLRRLHLLGPEGRPTSLRRAASELGVSPSTVWRALRRRSAAR